jgi:SAM-dependent methyltransferase
MKSRLYRIFERFARSLGVLEMQSRLDGLEAQQRNLEAQQKSLETSQMSLLQGLVEQSENAKTLIPMIQSVDRLNETRTRKLILDAKLEEDHHLVVQLRRDLDGIRAQVRSAPLASTGVSQAQVVSSPVIDDALYVSLEDRFRGDVQIVAQRQSEYIPFVSKVASPSTPVLDLGCGRGEWLLLLKEKNIASIGIDSNDAAVAECTALGLEVKKAELLSTLNATPSNSLGAVTMFQVLEHLPFNLVVEVIREALRVLIPGGIFIGEIPNCETLRVGASTFWIDPTHQRPLYPAVLEFIAAQVGFQSVEGKYSSPLSPAPDLKSVPEDIADVIRDLHYKVNGPGDFAIIAKA